MVKVPDRFNYISVSLTFRCNLKCSYCINDYSGIDRKVNEMTGEEWVAGLNNLDINKTLPLTFEGGEPSLHRDFYHIVNNVNHKVNILTNATFNIEEFVERVDPRKMMKGVDSAFKPIRFSFHADSMDINKTIDSAITLQDAGFGIGIFAINHPESVEQNVRMAEECRLNRIYFYIKDYLGDYNGELLGHYRYKDALDGVEKECTCRTNELLIDPAGDIFRCHRDLYAHEGQTANLLDDDLEIKHEFTKCSIFGKCNPCDVKLKTNRFLKSGNSSVEIVT